MGHNDLLRDTPGEAILRESRCRTSPVYPLAPAESRDSFHVGLRLFGLVLRDATSESLSSGDLWSSVARLSDLDPTAVLSDLDRLADAHLQLCGHGAKPDFVRSVLRSVLSPVRGLVTSLERGIGSVLSMDASAVLSWRQVFSFLLRPDYGLLEGGEYLQEWSERNRLMSLSEGPQWLRDDFNFVTDKSFESDCREYFFPHHGPGSVAFAEGSKVRTGRLPISEKDKLVRYKLPYDARFFSSLEEETDDVPSVLLDVPKSWKKRRVIAVESASRMFHQEGIKEGLFKAIERDSFWRRHIDFRRAELSHPLVRKGSLTGAFSTVDLSAASDSVKLGVVRQLFADRPWLLAQLLNARAQRVKIGNRLEEIRMFASMGNATTFPVETLLFGTACVHSIRMMGDHPDTSRFRVYGDDILIESRYYPVLKSVLQDLGFQVNSEKTFSDPTTRYRESCGVEFYNGFDVTPVRLPRGFCKQNFSVCSLNALSTWVDIANEMFRAGYRRASAEIRRTILSESRRAIPVSTDGCLGFITEDGRNSHLPSLYSPDFQRYTHIYPNLHSKTELRANGSLALYEWLGRAHARSAINSLSGEFLPDDGCSVPSVTSRVATGEIERAIDWF